ncbi:hypothetical protein BDW02DRAFT_579793 [Decorospora gaudefroyi]|uniref:Uncharacterized protein n=1 Tax=Decorospora gaudefroyi TaxID=184978 RepID=A0A6A5K9Z2_9PLEO|nr:hypothetical protein BDW02DRAFT_579793 [Decorospora gaudefroyi]
MADLINCGHDARSCATADSRHSSRILEHNFGIFPTILRMTLARDLANWRLRTAKTVFFWGKKGQGNRMFAVRTWSILYELVPPSWVCCRRGKAKHSRTDFPKQKLYMFISHMQHDSVYDSRITENPWLSCSLSARPFHCHLPYWEERAVSFAGLSLKIGCVHSATEV